MPIFFNILTYIPIRDYFLKAGWGDIFTYNGWFYRVEILGNALIPVAYFSTFVLPKSRYFYFCRIVFLVGTIFAGNFAYWISIFLFHSIKFYLTSKSTINFANRLFIGLLTILILSIPLYYFVESILAKKTTSLGSRWEQKDLLIEDMTQNIGSTIFGKGLGNTLEIVTPIRNYEGQIYFELQIIYFLNQCGVLFFIFFFILNIVFAINMLQNNYLYYLIYSCYILYALTNPYILDSNQIAVIFLLSTIMKINENKDIINYSDL